MTRQEEFDILKNNFLSNTDNSKIQQGRWLCLENKFYGRYYRGDSYRNKAYKNLKYLKTEVDKEIIEYNNLKNFLLSKYTKDISDNLINHEYTIGMTYEQINDSLTVNQNLSHIRFFNISKNETKIMKNGIKKRYITLDIPRYLFDDDSHEKLTFENDILSQIDIK